MVRINEQIETIRKDVWIEINSNLTALEKVKILNYILFDLHKLTRNNTDFLFPQNSYINQALKTRKGIRYPCTHNSSGSSLEIWDFLLME